MNEVKVKLKQITETWNHYFLNYQYCQKSIQFDDDVKTNYYGDILSYFNDTLSIIETIEYKPDFNNSVFQAVGILQIIYAQQDLLDELLFIFKLPKSTGDNKQLNRTIRNELIGHPIRRINGKLESSSFFGNEFSNGLLKYVLYSKGNRFSGKTVSHHLNDILLRHISYLNEYLDCIINKIKKILKDYSQRLSELLSLSNKGVCLIKILDMCSHYFEQIFKDNEAFKRKYLLQCGLSSQNHPRYLNLLNVFHSTLKIHLNEVLNDLKDIFVLPTHTNDEYSSLPLLKFISFKQGKKPLKNRKQYFNYEFSKLYEDHPIFGIDYFIELFKEDETLLDELLHLKKSSGSIEYYCSYEYLKVLFIEKDLIKDYFSS